MITMIIKGDESAVFAAADKHGIELTSIVRHPRFDECICTAPNHQCDRIVTWFLESNHLEAPYPEGSVTWYGVGKWNTATDNSHP